MHDKEQDTSSHMPEAQQSALSGASPDNQENRRKALKSALAGGVILAGNSTPAQWATPLVRGVILPAHAATSEAEQTSPTCPQITLEDRIASCGTTTQSVSEVFTFSIEEGCLSVRVDVTEFSQDIDPTSDQLVIDTRTGTDQTTGNQVVGVGVRLDGVGRFLFQFCADPRETEDPHQDTITVEGSEYSVYYNLTQTTNPATASITNITVSPAPAP